MPASAPASKPPATRLPKSAPLGLILNELITNSFKYAFAKTGLLTIRLQLNKKGDDYLLKYSDNGQGLPSGMDLERNQSLGLQLISRLSKQLGGRSEYRFENGCVFNIYFLDC